MLNRKRPIGESAEDWLNQFEEKYKDDPDFVAEGLALKVTEDAIEIMQKQGISRAELASRMGVSRAHVTQVLNAHPNLTLRSIAQLATALHTKPSVRLYDEEAEMSDGFPR